MKKKKIILQTTYRKEANEPLIISKSNPVLEKLIEDQHTRSK